MASSATMRERRRERRVLIRIPVTLFANSWDGNPIQATAEAVAVNRYGALLRAPVAPGLGARIEVMNTLSQEIEEFRVVRVAERKAEGLFEIGVEILVPRPDFWGIHFPDRSSPA
jgi:hypothetical protein